MTMHGRLLTESIQHTENARAILLAKYNPSWVGNEILVNINELSVVDGELFKTLSGLINLQKQQLSKHT